jgi:amine sulfotransferase
VFKAPHETIRKLCDFLGKDLSDEKVSTIVEWCSYEKMKSNPKVNYEWYKEFGLFKKDGQFLRKGIVGDWLNYFNPNLSKRFDNCIRDNLKATNIVFDYGISDDDQKKIHEYYSDVKK